MHRRRINTEEKAKVVAAVWGTEFIQFLAALALCTRTILTNRMNSFFYSNNPGAIHPILQFFLVQNCLCGKELNKFCPLNTSGDICLFFCIYPPSIPSCIGMGGGRRKFVYGIRPICNCWLIIVLLGLMLGSQLGAFPVPLLFWQTDSTNVSKKAKKGKC